MTHGLKKKKNILQHSDKGNLKEQNTDLSFNSLTWHTFYSTVLCPPLLFGYRYLHMNKYSIVAADPPRRYLSTQI